MLTNIQKTQLEMNLAQLTKYELKKFIMGNADTIANMKNLLDCARQFIGAFQEGKLTANFHEDVKLHQFTFSVTDAFIEANPDLSEIAAVIATQVKNYISEHLKNQESETTIATLPPSLTGISVTESSP